LGIGDNLGSWCGVVDKEVVLLRPTTDTLFDRHKFDNFGYPSIMPKNEGDDACNWHKRSLLLTTILCFALRCDKR
jgi:hypothetical protein